MIKLINRIILCLVLFSLITSSVAYAKKPVKLSSKHMAKTQGAIAPVVGVVIGAAVGAYAIAAAIDEVKGQYDYFTQDPNGKALAKKWEEHTKASNAKALSNPTAMLLGPLGMAVQQSISSYDFYTKNQDAINQWGRYTGDNNIRIVTDPKNIIAGAAGGVGAAAGAAFQGATGAVKLGAEGVNAAKPFVLGAGTELAKTTGKLVIQAPGDCLVDNNYALNNKTAACIKEKVIDKATDPLTWATVVGAGMGRGESYNSRNGDPNPDAYNGISTVNKEIKIVSTAKDVIEKVGDKQSGNPKDLICKASSGSDSGGGGFRDNLPSTPPFTPPAKDQGLVQNQGTNPPQNTNKILSPSVADQIKSIEQKRDMLVKNSPQTADTINKMYNQQIDNLKAGDKKTTVARPSIAEMNPKPVNSEGVSPSMRPTSGISSNPSANDTGREARPSPVNPSPAPSPSKPSSVGQASQATTNQISSAAKSGSVNNLSNTAKAALSNRN